MPILATLVVQYVIDAAQLTAQAANIAASLDVVTASADASSVSIDALGVAAADSSAYLDSLGSQAFTTGAGFDGMSMSADAMTASLDVVDATLASVADASSVANASIADTDTVLLSTIDIADAATVSLQVFTDKTVLLATSADAATIPLQAVGVAIADTDTVLLSASASVGTFATAVDLGALSQQEYVAYITESALALGLWEEFTTAGIAAQNALSASVDTVTASVDTSAASMQNVIVSTDAVSFSFSAATTAVTDFVTSLVSLIPVSSDAVMSLNAVALSEDKVAASSDVATASLATSKIALLAVGAIAVGVGVAVVKMAGNYQASVERLVTSAGEQQKNIKMVGDGMLSMSVQVGTGAQKLADAMYTVESGGFHGAAGLLVLKNAAEGAKAENADLAIVAKAVTSALNAYGEGADQSARVTNTLVAATAAGNMKMQDLASAVSNVIPATSKFHISLIDTTAAIATMTMQGDDASSAATHLRQVILALEAPAKAGASALASIGLSSEEVSKQMSISLPGAIQMITDALGKTFPEGSAKYNEALKNIAGGNKQLLGLLEASGSGMKLFKANVDAITGAVNSGGDSIANWSAIQDTFNFKIDKAKAVIEMFAIKVGTALLPVLGNLLDALSSPILIGFVSGVGDAIGTVFGWIGGVISATVVPAINAVVKFFSSPAFLNFADGAGKDIANVFGFIGNIIETLVKPALSDVSRLFTSSAFSGFAGGVGKGVSDVFGKIGGYLTDLVKPAMLDVVKYFESPAFKAFASGVGKDIADIFKTIGQYIADKVNPMIKTLTAYFDSPSFKTFVNDTGKKIVEVFVNIGTWINKTAIPALQNFWSFIITNIVPVLQSWGHNIQVFVLDKLADLKVFIDQQVMPKLQQLWQFIQNTVIPTLQSWGSNIKIWVIDKLSDLKTFIDQQVMPKLQELWQFIQTNIVPLFTSWGDEMGNVRTKFDDLKTFIDQQVMPVLNTLWSFVQTNIVPIFQSLGNIVKTDVMPHVDDLKTSTGNLTTALGHLWDKISPIILPVLAALGISAGVDTKGKFDGLKTAIDVCGTGLSDFLTGVNQGINVLIIIIDWLGTAIDWMNQFDTAIVNAAADLENFMSGGAAHAQHVNTAPTGGGAAVGHFAGGVENFKGGWALVGEKGPELLNLPSGTNVVNSAETSNLMKYKGNSTPLQGGSTAQQVVVHNHFYVDGKEITNNVQTRVQRETRRGPIR